MTIEKSVKTLVPLTKLRDQRRESEKRVSSRIIKVSSKKTVVSLSPFLFRALSLLTFINIKASRINCK
jgi:hypothetical protein